MFNGYDHNNLFAKILRGEIPAQCLYKDEYCLCFNDINPISQIHILLIPAGPFVDFAMFARQATDAEILGLFGAIPRLLTPGKYFKVFTNAGNGPLEKQVIYHFHLHLLDQRLDDATPIGAAQDLGDSLAYFDERNGKPNTVWVVSKKLHSLEEFGRADVVCFVRDVARVLDSKHLITDFNAHLVNIGGFLAWKLLFDGLH